MKKNMLAILMMLLPLASMAQSNWEAPKEKKAVTVTKTKKEKKAKKERKKREKKEKAPKEPKESRAIDVTPVRTIHFHVGAFLAGMGLVLIVLLGLMAYSYLRYEGIV